MRRILSVTSSRADVGMLTPVWKALCRGNACELHLFVTGMHCASEASAGAFPAEAMVHRGGSDLAGDAAAAARAMAAILRDAGAVCAKIAPDVMLIAGDRLDMLPAAAASLPYNIPLVHLHGGEVTEGAIDDRIRHALSKLAHLHCAASAGARERLLALGEEPWRIHVTGAPGLDTILEAHRLSARDVAQACEFAEIETLRLVTVHPETNSGNPQAPADAVLSALSARPAPTLFTAPNSDPGGQQMRAAIETFVQRRAWARFRDTLGATLYANAMRHAAVMIGNSSSGVIEAGLFGLPVINVGARQAGRERGANVIDTPNSAEAVGCALDRLGARPPRYPAQTPYGDGRAGPRVAEVLVNLPPRDRLLRKQVAAEVDAPLDARGVA